MIMTEKQVQKGTLILNKISSHARDIETLKDIEFKKINSITFNLAINRNSVIYGDNISIDCQNKVFKLIIEDIQNNIAKLEQRFLDL